MIVDGVSKVTAFQGLVVDHATGTSRDPVAYENMRRELLADKEVAPSLPTFVREYPTLKQFWPFIRDKFPAYQQRREYLWAEFRPVLDKVAGITSQPVDAPLSAALHRLSVEGVQRVWGTAVDRREADPEGAITAARTLLESVCKHILDDARVTYADKDDLPKLYGLAAKELRLSPGQHEEHIFRQILGGCHAVVEGLGSMRNKLGDAHGKGKKAVRPAARHAALAVNLAGAMAMFLVETWATSHHARSNDQGAKESEDQ